MKTYTIENSDTGIILGTYTAATEADALDALARDAGYQDRADVIDQGLASDLTVTEVGRLYIGGGIEIGVTA